VTWRGSGAAPAWMRAPAAPLARACVPAALCLLVGVGVAWSLRADRGPSPAEVRDALRVWAQACATSDTVDASDACRIDAVPLAEVRSGVPHLARQQAELRSVALELRTLADAPPEQRVRRRSRALSRLEEMSDAR
jgi:hypothetical protein